MSMHVLLTSDIISGTQINTYACQIKRDEYLANTNFFIGVFGFKKSYCYMVTRKLGTVGVGLL